MWPAPQARTKVFESLSLADHYTANLGTNIVEFRGFDSSIMLRLKGGIPRPIGNIPESLSQAVLAGIILVGRLGVVARSAHPRRSPREARAKPARSPRGADLMI